MHRLCAEGNSLDSLRSESQSRASARVLCRNSVIYEGIELMGSDYPVQGRPRWIALVKLGLHSLAFAGRIAHGLLTMRVQSPWLALGH